MTEKIILGFSYQAFGPYGLSPEIPTPTTEVTAEGISDHVGVIVEGPIRLENVPAQVQLGTKGAVDIEWIGYTPIEPDVNLVFGWPQIEIK